MKTAKVTCHAGVYKEDITVLSELAKRDVHARGSLREFTGSILRNYAAAHRDEVLGVPGVHKPKSRPHVAAGK